MKTACDDDSGYLSGIDWQDGITILEGLVMDHAVDWYRLIRKLMIASYWF